MNRRGPEKGFDLDSGKYLQYCTVAIKKTGRLQRGESEEESLGGGQPPKKKGAVEGGTVLEDW